MGLPDPSFKFTIPSVHDDTEIACRVYHPLTSLEAGSRDSSILTTVKKGAIVAHPYAPLGGCYDDAVVTSLAAGMLKEGFIVGTFNFRGAGGSKGRTSWTGKPELDDYTSVAGLMIHYLHHLQLPDHSKRDLLGNATSSPLTTIPSSVPIPIVHTSSTSSTLNSATSLLLGGYSYGSIIAKHLPPTPDIVMRFQTALEGSAEREIKLRAVSMAGQMSEQWEEERRAAQRGRQKPRNRSDTLQAPPVTMGGEETPIEVRRSSREIRRSMDRPHSVDIPRKLLRRVSGQKHSLEKIRRQATSEEDCEVPPPLTFYLLVSPLLPPVSTSLAVSLGQTFWKASNHSTAENISSHPTLAVTGGEDMFTASKSLRKWSQKYSATGNFTFEEVEKAGHFWRETGVEEKLIAILRTWLQALPG